MEKILNIFKSQLKIKYEKIGLIIKHVNSYKKHIEQHNRIES